MNGGFFMPIFWRGRAADPGNRREYQTRKMREHNQKNKTLQEELHMDFFNSAVDVLQMLVIAIGAGLAIWGVINLLEGYGQDNPASKGQG